jgi:hypothetical protein
LHVAKKNEEYRVRRSHKKTRIFMATMKKKPNTVQLFAIDVKGGEKRDRGRLADIGDLHILV